MNSLRLLIIFVFVITLLCCRNRERKVGFDKILPIEKVDCVFDTSSYKLTTAAIKKALPNKDFYWDKENRQIIVRYDNLDTLTLSIGGCNHYSYLASYMTDASKFGDSTYLFDKTLWMVENLFDGQIRDGYLKAFENKSFYRYDEEEPDFIPYGVKGTGVNENYILEGFFFTLIDNRTMIQIHGYIN